MKKRRKTSASLAILAAAGCAASVYAGTGVPAGARLVPVPGSSTVLALWNDGTPVYAVSLDGRTFSGARPAGTTIMLTYSPFDPLVSTPAIPRGLEAGALNELYLVQSWGAPVQSMQEAIAAAGGVVERYVADFTLVVRMTKQARAQVAALPFVRWVGPYHPAYRVDAQTLAFLQGASDAPARFSIETMRRGPAQQQALGTLIGALGGTVNVMTPDQFRMEATLTAEQLRVIVARNEVNFIDPWLGPGGHDMDILRQYGGAVPILSGLGMTGQGVRGEVFDTEVIANHQQWNGQPPLIHGVNGNSGLHGTSCYGINFATGTGNPQATGMCPSREQGIFCHYPQATSFGGGLSRLTLNTQLVDPLGTLRGHYQTSSVGNAQISTYSTISAETDDYLLKVDLLSCQSQSNLNSTSSRPEAWAKNIMAVGGMEAIETVSKADDTSSGASFGYGSDGRMKPELCHAYGGIFTTDGANATSYTQFGGTSGATPITAGHFGLLHQMWHNGVWSGFGGAPGPTVFGDTPRSTTARALMIAGAFRYDWAPPSLVNGFVNASLTRNRQGWGVADVGRLHQIRDKTFIVNETDVLLALETKSYNITVVPGEPRLNITMVYADPPGNPAVQTQHRINDVNLKVTAPTGDVYWGNWGLTLPTGGAAHSNWSVANGNPDTKNTVENVNVFQPAAGTWTVEVIAQEVVADAHLETPGVFDVDFGLAVEGGTGGGVPPPLFIGLPGGIPSLIPPGVATDLTVTVTPGSQQIVSGSPTMFLRLSPSGSFQGTPLTPLGGVNYEATLPPLDCTDVPQFYFRAEGDGGAVVTYPSTAPTNFFTTTVGEIQTNVAYTQSFDGGLPAGWTQSGLWNITANVCNTQGTCAASSIAYYGNTGGVTPCTYQTGSTANSGNLTSAPISLPVVPPGGTMTLEYCSALTTEANASYDHAYVFVNNTQVDQAGESSTWQTRSVDLAAFSGQTVTLRFFFETVDGVLNNFRGWQVDNLKISASSLACDDCYPDCDGVNGLTVQDFGCFQTKFVAGDPYADCDGVNGLTVQDFGCFQTKFVAGCP